MQAEEAHKVGAMGFWVSAGEATAEDRSKEVEGFCMGEGGRQHGI